ncbi:MAG: methyltransferase domain-containing protein, partial [Actinomycetota bacterium]|nr:methyltransferase domain-containing protein [Actinomycetota bacterium]
MSGTQEWRDRLVDALVAAGRIRNVPVAAAFRAVPRELFLPGTAVAQAYHDEAVVTRWDSDGRPLSSSSQPSIMAMMLEQLAVQPGDRVLEVGTGTGYNAALLAQLAGAGGRVVSLDIDEQVARQARVNLDRAGQSTVEVIHADGVAGWAAGAPYDRIILTASARDIAPAWLAQLARTGRLVLPLSLRSMQRSVAFAWAGEHLTSRSIVNCGFMPLRGTLAGPDGSQPLGPPGTFVMTHGDQHINPGGLQGALEQPGQQKAVDIAVSDVEVMGGLGLWVVLHEPHAALLTAVG